MTSQFSKSHRSNLGTLGLAAAVGALAVVGPAAYAQAPAARPAAAAQAEAPALNRAQIDALLASPNQVLVIDVRRADEISTIGGFPVFLNVQAGDLDKRLGFIPRDRKIVTVSNHAARAKRAAALLTANGFQVAGAAGAQDYEAQGGVLVGKKPAEAAASAAATGTGARN